MQLWEIPQTMPNYKHFERRESWVPHSGANCILLSNHQFPQGTLTASSLLLFLLRNIFGLTLPASGWNNLPLVTDSWHHSHQDPQRQSLQPCYQWFSWWSNFHFLLGWHQRYLSAYWRGPLSGCYQWSQNWFYGCWYWEGLPGAFQRVVEGWRLHHRQITWRWNGKKGQKGSWPGGFHRDA